MGRPKAEGMYTVARRWVDQPPAARLRVSKQRAHQLRRIADLGVWGRELERLGASYRLLRWVASPGPRNPVLREQRYRAALAALRTFWDGTDATVPEKIFRAMCAQLATAADAEGEAALAATITAA